jgi:hypothetical protein
VSRERSEGRGRTERASPADGFSIVDRLRRSITAACVAFVIGLWFTSVAGAAAPTLIERLISAQSPLQSKQDEPVDPRELASAIASVPKITREWAALILTVAGHESALSARIARGEYKDYEGDSFRTREGKVQHRAWGLWQAHRNRLNDAAWGSPDIRIQTEEAARALRRAFYQCNGGGHPHNDWVRSTLNSYSGRRCDASWPGLEKRLTTYQHVLNAL